MSFNVRPVRDSDACGINIIHRYYVEKTVLTFAFHPYTEQETLAGIRSILQDNMPYIVAIDSSDQVLGYMYATAFRPPKEGYRPSIEVSLFCHPDYTGRGIGSVLMQIFLDIVRDPTSHPEYLQDPKTFRTVRQIIAGMAIDVDGPRQGMALKEFYERFGFRATANMPQVGYKFDRWSVSFQLSQL